MTLETFNTVSGFIGTLASLAGVIFSVWAFYTHINRALTRLLDRHAPHLDMQQALDIVDFYLAAAQSEMREHSGSFLRNDLSRLIATKNQDEARGFVYNTTDRTLLHHRRRLSRFRLVDGSTVDQFLTRVSPISSGTVMKAKDDVYGIFAEAIEGSITADAATSRSNMIMGEAQNRAGAEIRSAVTELYQSRGDDHA